MGIFCSDFTLRGHLHDVFVRYGRHYQSCSASRHRGMLCICLFSPHAKFYSVGFCVGLDCCRFLCVRIDEGSRRWGIL